MTPARPPVLGLRHVALTVMDLERALTFYVGVLGFRVEWRPDSANAYLTTGTDNLALHEAPRDAKVLAGGQRLDHIGLIVPRPEDVDRFSTYLTAHGIPIEKQPRTHRDGARSLYVRDPEGTLVQILYHPPLAPAAP